MTAVTTTVKLGPGAGTTLQHVQALNFTQGRRKLTDVYRGGSGTITGRRPDLLPSMKIGDPIRIECASNVPPPFEFRFRIANFRINYGFTSALDTWEIEIEDAFAYLGRGTVTKNVVSGSLITTLFTDCCVQNGITPIISGTDNSLSSAQNIEAQNALDVMQTCVNTTQARVYAQGDTILYDSRSFWQENTNIVTFADDGTGTFTFNEIDFGTLADNYADQVVIFPRGGSEAVVGDGIFNYNLDSYSLNNQEAIYLGEYLLGSLVVDQPVIRTISYFVNAQTTVAPFAPLLYNSQVAVKFRGNSFDGIVEGYQVFATPSDIRVQLFVSDASFYNFFVLDNPLFGTLNTNKLGW